MKKKVVVKNKRNPQDATLRNINALKKRVNELEKRLEIVVIFLNHLKLDPKA